MVAWTYVPTRPQIYYELTHPQSIDEASLYLSTFKQYEHKPPDLIKERVDKDYDSCLRSSLTSISRVNKTDVETLKTSLGSFADIAKTPADRLRNLPGFGQVKVKKIKDAFEKSFRNNATSTLTPQSRSIFDSSLSVAGTNTQGGNGKGKGKEKIPSLPESSTTALDHPRPPREPSPVWDLELDLDVDVDMDAGIENHISPESGPPPVSRPTYGSSSPAWDIELDLGGSDGDDGKGKHGFGAAALLS